MFIQRLSCGDGDCVVRSFLERVVQRCSSAHLRRPERARVCPGWFSSALPLLTTSPSRSSLSLVRSTSCAGPVPPSLVTSLVPVFQSVLLLSLDCAPDPDDPPWVTGVCGGSAIFFLKLQVGMPFVHGSLVALQIHCIGQGAIDPHPYRSKSVLRRYALATLFSISTSPGKQGTTSAGLSVPT